MRAKKVLIIVLGFLGALALGVILTVYLFQGFDLQAEKPYYAVQMVNGDIYFGKISYFPRFTLKDAYIIQTVSDPTNPLGTSLQITSLSQAALWGPDEVVLNRDNVISISKVSEASQVMRGIRER